MFLEIVTPEKKIFEGEADSAIFPGADGSFQILNDHAALVSTLEKGTLTADKDIFQIEGGVVEVLNNKVLILAEGIN